MSDEIILNDLAHLPVWVGWREEQRNGEPTKVPYDPRTGGEAKSTAAATWATRGEAETWAIANRGAGVGIVLSQLNGGDCCLCGIDLDSCRDPTTETFQDWAQEVVDRFETYTEVSPSGTGAKLFFRHASADLLAIERLFDGKGGRQFKNGNGRHCPAIEIYRTGRYFTVTDESIGPTDILRQVSLADLEWLIREAGPRFAHKESQKNGSSGTDQSRSAKAFRKGATLKATGYSYDAMRDALLADADPEIAEWARTKGLANNEREMHRIYENAGDNGAPAPAPPTFTAQPFVWRDPRTIKPRQWLHARHYIRGFVSATIAPGGLGKSSLQLIEAVGMAAGRDLLRGTTAKMALKVWYWNLEDPREEIDRRIAAILLHYKIHPDEINGRLFVNSGRDKPLVIAEMQRGGAVVHVPVAKALRAEITRLGVDVLIIDPFVSCHRLPENDNGAIDAVVKTWAAIAEETKCSVELAHHVRKPGNGSAGAEFDLNDARGASSLIGAARSARVLNVMSKDEAEAAGVPEKHRRAYFRCQNGKANMRPASDETEWHKFVSVSLENDTPDDPADEIGVVTTWKRPGLFDNMAAADLFTIQKAIAAGQWREDARSPDWAGNAVATVLDLDVTAPADKTRLKAMLKVWIETKALKIVEKPDAKRMPKRFVEVGIWAT